MTKYKAYPEYKDSGIEWLGEIPRHWQRFPLKYLVEMKSGESITAADIEPEGNYPVFGGNGLRGYSSKYTHSGSYVLIGRQGALCGNVNYAHNQFWASEHALVVKGKKSFNIRWLGELLRAMNLNQYSITAAQPGLSAEALVNLQIPVPPEAEREAVALFIGYEAEKIDNLIEKQQQLIELLKEKRQAVISHAVTKGLNPDAPMKDSGVEWLGDVPEHWKRSTPIKYLSSLKGRLGWQGLKADEYRDEGPYVVSSAHFNNYEIDWNSCPRVSLERYKLDSNIQLDVGDILLMKDGAAMGKLSYVDQLPGKACLNSHLLLFRPLMGSDEKTYDTKFMFYLMQTNHFQSFIKNNGTGSTFLGISQQAIGNHSLCLPPYNEQVEISNYLDDELSKIVRLETMQLEMKNLLTERRTALISAAVTGKIDVRDWVAPDTQDVEEPQEATV